MVDDAIASGVSTLNTCDVSCLVAFWQLVDLLGAGVQGGIWCLNVVSIGLCSLVWIWMEDLIDILWSMRALTISWILPGILWL